MLTPTDDAALATAAGAVLAGLAQVLTALRAPGDRSPAPAAAGGAGVAAGAGGGTAGGGPTADQLARTAEAARLAQRSLVLGVCAWLLAVVVVVVVAATSVSLNSAPFRALEWASITLAALAVGSGALSQYQSVASGVGPARPLRAAAGLAISLGALAALLVAGT